MYEGSMVRAGMNVFAVWNYAIAKCKTGVLEINPKLVAFILGGTEKEVQDAIDYLCAPDPASRSKECEGRRLVKEGEYQYRMVNWGHYQSIKNDLAKKEYNREQQRLHRERVKAAKMSKMRRAPGAREEKENLEHGDSI